MAESSARKPYRRAGGPAVIAAAAALGLAACGGSGSPQVARLSESGSHGGGAAAIIEAPGNTTPATRRTDSGTPTTSPAKGSGTVDPTATTTPKGDPTQLLDEWAACMRAHGDPDQVDPTIDANKDIEITISPSIQGGYSGYSVQYGSGGPGVYCRSYLTAAQTALGGTPNAKPDPAKLLKFSECMRANGFPNFPDPSGGGGLVVPIGGELTPNNPAFKSASKLCAQKTGARVLGGGPPPPGTIKVNSLGAGSAPGSSGAVADG